MVDGCEVDERVFGSSWGYGMPRQLLLRPGAAGLSTGLRVWSRRAQMVQEQHQGCITEVKSSSAHVYAPC